MELLCQGDECKEMARWAIIIRGKYHSLKRFACHECKNNVERDLTNEGERLGLNRVVVSRIR